MSKNLYALLIGINGYPNCRPLSGCINDALAVSDYFTAFCAHNQLTPVFRYLLAPSDTAEANLLQAKGIAYERPERATVVRAIRDLFEQANPQRGDCCLLYYSGHGSTLPAPDAFSEYEPSGKLQTIVCVDSRDEGNRDLLDKELGYLIAEGLKDKAYNPDNAERPGVHFLSIMDCCHAGNNLRGDEDDFAARMVSGKNLPIRAEDLEGFAAAGNAFYAPLANGKVDRYSGLRHARYVGFSASRDHQPALEKAFDAGTGAAKVQHGVFTWSLLRALQRSGALLSYGELMRRIDMEVRSQSSPQAPLLWTRDGSDDYWRRFLGDETLRLPAAAFEVAWRQTFGGIEWYANAGALHGITPSTPQQQTTLLLQDGSERVVAVRAVYAHESILESALFTEADQSASLTATLHHLSFTRLRVGFDKTLSPDMRAKIVEGMATGSGTTPKMSYFELVTAESSEVDYLIRSVADDQKRDCFILTPKGTKVPLYTRNPSVLGFLSDLECVGKWAFTLQIANPAVEKALRPHIVVEAQVLEGVRIDKYNAREYASSQWDTVLKDPPALNVRMIDDIKPAVKIKISNHSFEKYWVGVLYLDAQYGITSKLAPISQIGAGGEAGFMEMGRYREDGTFNPILLMSLDSFYHEYGITEVTDYLLIVVSRQKFDLDLFDQDSLPLDLSRTIGSAEETEPEEMDQWFTIKIPVHIQYPLRPVQISGPEVVNATRTYSTGLNYRQAPKRAALSLSAAEGFSAAAQLTTRANVQRLTTALALQKDQRNSQGLLDPGTLWTGIATDSNVFVQGKAEDPDAQLSVIELTGVSGRLNADTPLVLVPGDPLLRDTAPDALFEEIESVIPYGYHPEGGFFVPLGFTDAEGRILVTQLPDATDTLIGADGAEGAKSLGGSFKLFFQKLVWSKWSGRAEYNTLALHRSGEASVAYRSNSARFAAAKVAIQDALNQEGDLLLLLHGITGDTHAMHKAVFEKTDLHTRFAAVLTFDYENFDTDLEKTAETLHNMLVDCGLPPHKKLTVIAQSMGGLVARRWIERGGGAAYVKKLIQTGTPNAGSELSALRKKLALLLTLGMNAVERFKPYLAVLSHLTGGLGQRVFNTLRQIEPGSDFLARLNGNPAPDVPYYLLAGDTADLEAIFAGDDPIWKKIQACLSKRGLYLLADEVVFDDQPNDMAVRKESMKAVPWGHVRVEEVSCDHLSYYSNLEALEKLKGLVEDLSI